MDLLIFNKIEEDQCIKGVLEKDNVVVLRNVIEFSETEGVTNSAIKEYVATRLANDDNTYIICIGSPAKIVSNPFDMEPKNLRALNTVVRSFVNANVIVIKVSTGEIIMDSNDHTVLDKYLKNIK